MQQFRPNTAKGRKYILLAQNTGPNSKLDQDTRNLTQRCGQLARGADLQVDTWGPRRRGGMGPFVGSSAVVDGLESAQAQCH